MDLCEDKIWLGANESRIKDKRGCTLSLPPAIYDTFSRVEYVLNNLVDDTYGKSWEIHVEEDFSKDLDTGLQDDLDSLYDYSDTLRFGGSL